MTLKDFAREKIAAYNGDKNKPENCKEREKRKSSDGPMLPTNKDFNPIGYNIKQRVY